MTLDKDTLHKVCMKHEIIIISIKIEIIIFEQDILCSVTYERVLTALCTCSGAVIDSFTWK